MYEHVWYMVLICRTVQPAFSATSTSAADSTVKYQTHTYSLEREEGPYCEVVGFTRWDMDMTFKRALHVHTHWVSTHSQRHKTQRQTHTPHTEGHRHTQTHDTQHTVLIYILSSFFWMWWQHRLMTVFTSWGSLNTGMTLRYASPGCNVPSSQNSETVSHRIDRCNNTIWCKSHWAECTQLHKQFVEFHTVLYFTTHNVQSSQHRSHPV